jgi:hypothetical protein
MRSDVDGMEYKVQANHRDPQAAADQLAVANRTITRVLAHLKRRYGPRADPATRAAHPERVAAVKALMARYSPDNFVENSPSDPGGDTSYTIDKGALVALCLRERSAGAPLHDQGTISFVAIHELAHIAIDDIDHPPRFWEAFRFLLQEAHEAGVPGVTRNYSLAPLQYCGMNVNYSPLYDTGVRAM